MKILLLQAYNGKHEPAVYPLGLSSLATVLSGHIIKYFDPNVTDRPDEELAELLSGFRPDVVGISIRNIDSTNKRKVVFYYDYVHNLIDIITRIMGKEAKIIVGGSGFSIFAQTIMDNEPRIDLGVAGEAEYTFPKLIDSLESPEKVKNIFFRQDGRVVFSGADHAPHTDMASFINQYPLDASAYRDFPDAIGVETKRGCALNCVYCVYVFLNGKTYRLRKPERVVDEIELLIKQYQIKQFTFVDSTFNVPVGHAEAICKEMIHRGMDIKWSAWFHDKYLTLEFVELAKQAGCRKFILSPDGFSDQALECLGKSQRMKDVMQGYQILKSVDGIEICYNFFKNPPGQTWASFIRMMLFCLKAKRELKHRIHFEFSTLRIEPYTGLHDIALREGAVTKDDNLLYPVQYTNKKTRSIETLFNLLLRVGGK